MTSDWSHHRARLQAELDELARLSAQAATAGRTVELDQTRVGRLSRMDALQQQAMAQHTRARYELRRQQVAAALARIAAGRYGRCCECEDDLPAKRLAADPAAVFCADCAAERERH
ncbi:MAG: molecular chaperone DnaK [Chromatiaceae bacterium]|nr:MAG: molecular chaperone DnaK [Chromatiaceae bacterium]